MPTMGARMACIAAALFAPGVAGSSDTSEVHAVFQGVLSAVESYWSSVDSLGEGGSLDGGADALALVSDSGTIELEPLTWTGSSTNEHVQCTDCSVHATRTLTYNCTVVDGELQYLTVLVTTAGRAKLSYTATVDSTSSFAPITEPVEFVGSNTVTATFGGVSCDIDVSTNITTTLIAGTSSADAEQVSGEIQANLTTRAGFVYTADGGVQPIADETSQYWAEQFDIAANESPPPGVAAHVSLDLAQTVLIDGLVELKTITQPAMQIFSSPGDLIVSDSDFFYTQAFLCLFDSDCPNDEVCVSSGECISYQRQGGSTYVISQCTQLHVQCCRHKVCGVNPGTANTMNALLEIPAVILMKTTVEVEPATMTTAEFSTHTAIIWTSTTPNVVASTKGLSMFHSMTLCIERTTYRAPSLLCSHQIRFGIIL